MTTDECDPIVGVTTVFETLPDDIDALKVALLAERAARREFEARASGAAAMVAHLKLLIAKMKRDRFGASAERGGKLLDRLEMQLEEPETAAAEDEAAAAHAAPDKTTVRPFMRAKPVRAPLPAQLPRERAVPPSPTSSLRWHSSGFAAGTLASSAHAAAASSPSSARPSPRRWRASRAATR